MKFKNVARLVLLCSSGWSVLQADAYTPAPPAYTTEGLEYKISQDAYKATKRQCTKEDFYYYNNGDTYTKTKLMEYMETPNVKKCFPVEWYKTKDNDFYKIFLSEKASRNDVYDSNEKITEFMKEMCQKKCMFDIKKSSSNDPYDEKLDVYRSALYTLQSEPYADITEGMDCYVGGIPLKSYFEAVLKDRKPCGQYSVYKAPHLPKKQDQTTPQGNGENGGDGNGATDTLGTGDKKDEKKGASGGSSGVRCPHVVGHLLAMGAFYLLAWRTGLMAHHA